MAAKTNKSRFLRWWGRVFGAVSDPVRPARRSYQAGKISRHDRDWTTLSTLGNYENRQYLRVMRARARDLCRNDPHAKRFLKILQDNVIGSTGIRMQSRAKLPGGEMNLPLNAAVETAWKRWCKKQNCTASGKLSFLGVKNLSIRSIARDGEVLIRKFRGADNPFGFAVQVINADYLDETYNELLPNGNRVIMSVEVDPRGRPAAYWLTTPATEYMFNASRGGQARTRVPADEILHVFLPNEDEDATRGMTWFHAALLALKRGGGYMDGVILSARAAAYAFGLLMEKEADETAAGYDGDEEDDRKDFEIEIEPMSVQKVPAGFEFSQFDPKQPTQNHPEFYKSILQTAATALDVNYFHLAGDLEAVNFSSARIGLEEERDGWRGLQTFVIEYICEDIYRDWLQEAVLAGAIKIGSVSELLSLAEPQWVPRGWRYIDPAKDMKANIDGINAGLESYTDVYAEQGKDFDEELEKIKSEREKIKAAGLEFDTSPKPAAASPSPDEEDPDKAPPAKSKKKKNALAGE